MAVDLSVFMVGFCRFRMVLGGFRPEIAGVACANIVGATVSHHGYLLARIVISFKH